MQVLGGLTLLIPLIKGQYPNITKISIQSDNVSCLASHASIAYIQHLSKELEGLGLPALQWIYIETHAVNGQPDIHDALSCNAGLTDSTGVLDDGARRGADKAVENPNMRLVKTIQGAKYRPPRDSRSI
jgi:hypothetical protein